MNTGSFKIALPASAMARRGGRTPVKIRNSKLSVIQVVDLDELVSLPPGYYAAQAALPDGREFEAAFEVPDRGRTQDVELELSEDEAGASLGDVGGGAASQQLVEAEPDRLPEPARSSSPPMSRGTISRDSMALVPQDAAVQRPRVQVTDLISASTDGIVATNIVPDPNPTLVASLPRVSLVHFNPGEQVQKSTDWLGMKGQISIAPIPIESQKDTWLRVGLPGLADCNIAMPVSYSEGATFIWEVASSSWRFALSNPDADAALGYLRHKRIAELSWLAAQNGPIWHAMFDADHDLPIAGTVGAYALLLTGGAEVKGNRWSWDWSQHLQWSKMLVQNRQAPADALAIHGELLARQGHYDEAMEAFWRLETRGLPIFSIGLRLLVDRLLSCWSQKVSNYDSQRIDAMVQRYGTLSNYVDFDQPVLSFTTDPAGRLGTKPRKQWEEMVRARATR